MSTKRFQKVLVIAMPLIGDVLLATPLVRGLRRAHPKLTLDVLVQRNQAGILEGNTDIDETIPVATRPNAKEYRELLGRLGRRYDLAISICSSDRAHFYLLAAARTRISAKDTSKRGGWTSGAWKRWITDGSVVFNALGEHRVVQNIRLGELAGVESPLEVVPPRAADAAQVLSSLLAETPSERPIAVVHLHPGMPYKRWTAPGWATVLTWLDQTGFRVVLTGSGDNAELQYIDSLTRDLPIKPVNLAGKLRLGHLTALLERSAVYIGPDTVATHMAASVGTPTVALFGPTDPTRWGPWPRDYDSELSPYQQTGSQQVGNVLLLQGPGACVPCQQSGCERHKWSRADCLLGLEPQRVITGIQTMLDQRLGN